MKSKVDLAFLAALVFVASACGPTTRTLRPGEVVLKPGESIVGTDPAIEVTFVEIVQDSRCPADAMCVWAGQVQVLLQVTHGTERFQYTLTLGEMSEGQINSIAVDGYVITLTQVNPYPLASQPTNPGDYKITLDIQADM